MLAEGVGGNGRTSWAPAGVPGITVAPPMASATNSRSFVRIVCRLPIAKPRRCLLASAPPQRAGVRPARPSLARNLRRRKRHGIARDFPGPRALFSFEDDPRAVERDPQPLGQAEDVE